MHKTIGIILGVLPFVKNSTAYEPTSVKTLLIYTGISTLFIIYLSGIIRNKRLEIKPALHLFFLVLLSVYIIINFTVNPFSSSEKLVFQLLSYAFFLSYLTFHLLPSLSS